MVADPDFWKNIYKSTWAASHQREISIAQKIHDETGKDIEFVGLGAGSDVFLSGTALANGVEMGAADLLIKETNIYIEVTGPLVDSVRESDALWIRPDKIENAISNHAHETWLIHHLPRTNLLRVVEFNEDFFRRYKNSEFKIAHPLINGQKEAYVEIPATDRSIASWSTLITRLK